VVLKGGIRSRLKAGDDGGTERRGFVSGTSWGSFAGNIAGLTTLFEIAFECGE
jgi:hypothetical protein